MAVRALVLAVVIAALAPAGASAFHLGGERWPGGVVRYHSTAHRYDAALRLAVRSWNRSGARVHLRAVPAGRAQLSIHYGDPGLGAAGKATLGRAAPDVVTSHSLGGVEVRGATDALCGRRLPVPPELPGPSRLRMKCSRGPQMVLRRPGPPSAMSREGRTYLAVTVAHELGHVLGLRHNQPGCAVMSYRREQNCPAAKEKWRYRCRLLERDDVRGAVARYGGRVRPLARPFCERAPAPKPPEQVTAALDPYGDVHVSWARSPGDTTFEYRAAGAFGGCPTDPEAVPGYGLVKGARQEITLRPEDGFGPWCVAVWHQDQYGRLVGPATATVTVPPPPPDPFAER